MEIGIQIITAVRSRRENFSSLAGRRGGRVGRNSRGVVRGEENGSAIAALEYEAYSPMAEQVMRQIITGLGTRHPCQFVRVVHRIGIVPVGEAAIHILVAARHRAEAFAMLTEFMNRLKQDVPIWKRRAWSHGELAALKNP